MRNGEMHAFSIISAIALTGALLFPTVFLADKPADAAPPLKDYEVIEASLAYKAPGQKPLPKQPQKEKDAPNPETKIEGVSHDENKKVDEKKDEKKTEPKKPDDKTDPLAKYRRDQENDVGAVVKPSSDDGSEFGRGNISKGDPYFQRLWADLEWSVPELAKTGGQQTIACIKMNADGTVAKTFFKQKGDDDVATLADKAMDDLKAKRNASPIEVPTHLLDRLTTKGICFNLTAT